MWCHLDSKEEAKTDTWSYFEILRVWEMGSQQWRLTVKQKENQQEGMAWWCHGKKMSSEEGERLGLLLRGQKRSDLIKAISVEWLGDSPAAVGWPEGRRWGSEGSNCQQLSGDTMLWRGTEKRDDRRAPGGSSYFFETNVMLSRACQSMRRVSEIRMCS